MSLVCATETALFSVDFQTGNLIKQYKQCENLKGGLQVLGPQSSPSLLAVQNMKPLIHQYNLRKEAVSKRIVLAAKMNSLSVSPDNQWLAAGSKDGTLYLWNLKSGGLRALHNQAHFQEITALAWSKDSSVLVSGGADARVLVWRLLDLVALSKGPKHTFSNHTLAITGAVIGAGIFREARLYTSSLDSTCCVYDLFSGKLLYTLVSDSKIHCLCVDPAERAVYLGCDDGCHLVPLYSEAANKLFAVGTQNGVVSTNSIERICKPGSDISTVVTALCLSVDGSYVIGGTSDGNMVSWESSSGQLARKYRSSKGSVTQIVWLESVGSTDAETQDLVVLQRNLEGDNLMGYVPRPVHSQVSEENDIQEELESIERYQPVEHQKSPVDQADNAEVVELRERLAKLQKMYDALWAKHTSK